MEEAGGGSAAEVFAARQDTEAEAHETLKARLYQEIGQLKMELNG